MYIFCTKPEILNLYLRVCVLYTVPKGSGNLSDERNVRFMFAVAKHDQLGHYESLWKHSISVSQLLRSLDQSQSSSTNMKHLS